MSVDDLATRFGQGSGISLFMSRTQEKRALRKSAKKARQARDGNGVVSSLESNAPNAAIIAKLQGNEITAKVAVLPFNLAARHRQCIVIRGTCESTAFEALKCVELLPQTSILWVSNETVEVGHRINTGFYRTMVATNPRTTNTTILNTITSWC
jgi:hypothetical protein